MKTLGQVAYEEASAQRGWYDRDGWRIPCWSALSASRTGRATQALWEQVGRAVLRELGTRSLDELRDELAAAASPDAPAACVAHVDPFETHPACTTEA